MDVLNNVVLLRRYEHQFLPKGNKVFTIFWNIFPITISLSPKVENLDVSVSSIRSFSKGQ